MESRVYCSGDAHPPDMMGRAEHGAIESTVLNFQGSWLLVCFVVSNMGCWWLLVVCKVWPKAVLFDIHSKTVQVGFRLAHFPVGVNIQRDEMGSSSQSKYSVLTRSRRKSLQIIQPCLVCSASMRRHHPIASHWDQSGPTPCTQEQLQELASYVQEVSEAGVEFSNSVDAFNPGNPGNELTVFWDVLNMILYVDTPKLTAKAPKNQWLEDDIYFLLGPGLVSGVMLVSGMLLPGLQTPPWHHQDKAWKAPNVQILGRSIFSALPYMVSEWHKNNSLGIQGHIVIAARSFKKYLK